MATQFTPGTDVRLKTDKKRVGVVWKDTGGGTVLVRWNDGTYEKHRFPNQTLERAR